MGQNFTLITGAGSGLGKELAIESAKRGKNVALVSLPGGNLKKLCQQLQDTFHVKAVYFEADLTEKQSVYEVVAWVRGTMKVDFLINNAGAGGSYPFEDSAVSELDQLLQLNIRAMVLLTRLMLPLLKQHSKSYILNVSSIAALSPLPYKVVYAASKSFTVFFTRGLREEMKDTQIRMSVLLPGPMLTNPDVVSRILQQGFLARLVLLTPEEISKVALNSVYHEKFMIIPGFANKMNIFLAGLLPLSLRLNILSRIIQNELNAQHALK